MTRLALVAALVLGACHSDVVIYHHLSEGNAMQTCDANRRMRVEVVGATAAAAQTDGERQMRSAVKTAGGCGALVTNSGTGSKLDGGFTYAADYQVCRCK